MAWQWDAPSGTFKNHALSPMIRRVAVAEAMFMRWVTPERGYGKNRGDTVTITRILTLPLAGRVSETDRLPSGRPAIQTKSLKVSEWGYKIPITQFEQNLTSFNVRNEFQKTLKDQISLTTDKMVADAYKLTPYKYIPVSTGGVSDTDGTPSTAADVNLKVKDLREIYDALRGTLKVPPFKGGRYIGVLSTKAARGIKNDSEYKDWLSPTDASPILTGILKDIEGFMLFETNHFDSLDNSIGTGGVLGEALFFGDDGAFLAVVENPELRAGIPDDLGRFREVGWVGTLEAGLTWENAAQARVIHVTSS